VEVVLDAVFDQDSSASMGLSIRMIGIVKHIPSDLEIVFVGKVGFCKSHYVDFIVVHKLC